MSEGEHGAGSDNTASTTSASGSSLGRELREDEGVAVDGAEAEPELLLDPLLVGVADGLAPTLSVAVGVALAE